MAEFDYTDDSFVEEEPEKKNFSIDMLDIFSILLLIGTACLGAYFLLIFINPFTALNPAPPNTPIPPINGGFQRSNMLGRALQRIGEVQTLYIRPASGEALTEEHRERLRREFGLIGVIEASGRGSMIDRAWARLPADSQWLKDWEYV